VVFVGSVVGGVKVSVSDELVDRAAGLGGYCSPACASGRLLWQGGMSSAPILLQTCRFAAPLLSTS
jgi:hypothetical protein